MEIVINGLYVWEITENGYTVSPDRRSAEEFTHQDLNRLYKILLSEQINYKVRIELITQTNQPYFINYVIKYLGHYVQSIDFANHSFNCVPATADEEKLQAYRFTKADAEYFINEFPGHTFFIIPL